MLPMICAGSYEVRAGARHVDDAAPADRDRVEAGRRRTAEHLEHVVRAGEQTATVRVEQNRSVHDTVRYEMLFCIVGQLSLASLRGRLIEYQLRLG